MNLIERLRYWAQNEEMIDQHFTAHGRDCNAAAECMADLLAALDRAIDDAAAARAAIAKARGQ